MELSLWDTGNLPVQNLNACFSGSARIFNRAADPQQPEIRNADFAFFDPPKSCQWAEIKRLINALRSDCSVMVWLPVSADTTITPPGEDHPSGQVRDEALRLGFGVSKIRWANGGGTIGCQLLYRVNTEARAAIKDALDNIVDIARKHRGNSPKWTRPLIHYDPW